MKCPSCDFENENGVRFCANCGTKLIEEIQQPVKNIFCQNCGQENSPASRFCENCGSEIILGVPASPAAPLPTPRVAPVSQAIPEPVRLRKGIPGVVWMLLGLAVILGGASLFYFRTNTPSAPVAVIPVTVTVESVTAVIVPVVQQELGTCKSDEKLLYSEDFQDGKMEKWQDLPAFYAVGPALDDKNNLVLVIQKQETTVGQVQAGPHLNMTPFTNAALRLRFYIAESIPEGDQNWFSFNWLSILQPVTVEGKEVYDSRYQLPIGYNYFEMRRLQQPLTNVSVNRSATYPIPGRWYALEIVTEQPRTEVWLDGRLVMEYEDPEPLPPGTFGLEAWLENPQVKLLFDDIVICELSAAD